MYEFDDRFNSLLFIYSNVNCNPIVTPQMHRFRRLNFKLMNKIRNPNKLRCGISHGSILGFCTWTWHHCLFLTLLWHKVPTNKYIISKSRSSMQRTLGPLYIKKSFLFYNEHDSYIKSHTQVPFWYILRYEWLHPNGKFLKNFINWLTILTGKEISSLVKVR